MIDIVYPLRAGGSRVDDMELRYSLRSLQAFLRMEVRDLYILGHRPEWLHPTHHIAMTDREDKAINLIRKYRKMMELPSLSDPFLLLDDDHIFLAPTDHIALHHRGPLWTLLREYRGTAHGRYLKAALDLLTQHGLPSLNYQIHYPLLIDKRTLSHALSLIGLKPMVMGSVYGNLVGEGVEIPRDFRVNTDIDFAELKDGHFISLPPIVKNPRVVELVKARLPQPSQWEQQPQVVAA